MNILEYIDIDLLQNAQKIYFKPQIPTQKMENAIKSFGLDIKTENINILIDNTLFGSAKEGVLITNDTLYCKELLKDPFVILLSKIESITVKKNTLSSSLVLNDKKSIIDLSQPEYDDLDLLFGGINVYLEERNEFDVLDEDKPEDKSLEYDEVDQEVHNLFMSCFKDDFLKNLSADEEALKRDKELLIKEINYLESAKASIQKDIEKLNKIKSLSKGRTSKIATYLSEEIPVLLADREKYLQIINGAIGETKELLKELIENEELSYQELENEIEQEEPLSKENQNVRQRSFLGKITDGVIGIAKAGSCLVGWHAGEWSHQEGKPLCYVEKTCPRCNKYVTAIHHNYGQWIYTYDGRCDARRQCSHCKHDEFKVVHSHERVGKDSSNCRIIYRCRRCRDEYLGSAEHDWITLFDKEVKVNTSEGKKRKCRNCGTWG